MMTVMMMMMMVHIVMGLLVLLLLLQLLLLAYQMRFQRYTTDRVWLVDVRNLWEFELCLAGHRCRCRLMSLQAELRWTGRC